MNIRLTANTHCMACHLRHPQHRQALCCAYCHCCNTSICQSLDRQRYSAPGMEKVSAPEEWFLDTAAQSHSCPDVILGRDRRPSERPAGFCAAGSLATSHPMLLGSPWPFWAGESRRSCVQIEVHHGCPGCSPPLPQGHFYLLSSLSCIRLPIPGLNGGV